MGLLRKLVHRAYLSQTAGAWHAFVEASQDPEAAQKKILFETLRANRETAYGKRYGFSEIHSLEEFRRRVPVVRYDDLAPWIDRAVAGEKQVLTSSDILIFERTSGSTQANKLIPYTPEVLKQFGIVVSAWMHNLMTHRPQMQGGASYWSVSQAVKKREHTAAGIPIGFESDVEYLGRLERLAWGILTVGGESFSRRVSQLKDIEDWKRETSLALLEEAELSFVSIWSPTFFSRILEYVTQNYASLRSQVSARRRNQLPASLSDPGDWARVWPRLQTLSSWMDGPSVALGERLRAQMPWAWIQPKGLLATEGVVSFPVLDGKHSLTPVAVHAMWVEFAAVDSGGNADLSKISSSWELKEGQTYTPILTSRGGLYRYHLSDVVICDGFYARVPSVRFLSKLDRISDLAGEKLNAQFVQSVVQKVLKERKIDARFVLLAPSTEGTPHYVFFVEVDASEQVMGSLAKALDDALSENSHYAYCRKLGQLGALQVHRVHGGVTAYENHLARLGMKMGDIKPTVLDHRTGWEKAFSLG